MIDSTYITAIFSSIGFLVFAFLYWRDATEEGYSSDKIFDSLIIILIGGLIGGKVFLRPFSYDYYRYQMISAPLVLEGALIGGAIAAYIVVKKNKWEFWKIGDMIAPGLTLFQAIMFFGFWVKTGLTSTLILSILFVCLYALILVVKKRSYRNRGLSVAQLKRIDRKIFTGAFLTVYLTGASLIAMLFLVTHPNTDSRVWWFQVIFYLLVFFATFFAARKAMNKQDISMGIMLPTSFINNIKSKLFKREKEIVKEEEHLHTKDPFIQEHDHDGTRNMDDLEEEVNDLQEHENVVAQEKELEEEKEEVKDAEEKITSGTYGTCEKCGKPIDKKRLEAYPTAKLCMECSQ